MMKISVRALLALGFSTLMFASVSQAGQPAQPSPRSTFSPRPVIRNRSKATKKAKPYKKYRVPQRPSNPGPQVYPPPHQEPGAQHS